jgi:hypothetical protein
MVPFSLVYFEGPWSEKDAALIEDAAQAVEAGSCSKQRGDLGAPWVAVAHDTGASGMYVASRQGNVRVLTAGTPEALARKIRSVKVPSFRMGL